MPKVTYNQKSRYKEICSLEYKYFHPLQPLRLDSRTLKNQLSPRKQRLSSIRRMYFLKVIIISGPFPNWPQIVAYRMGFLRDLWG